MLVNVKVTGGLIKNFRDYFRSKETWVRSLLWTRWWDRVPGIPMQEFMISSRWGLIERRYMSTRGCLPARRTSLVLTEPFSGWHALLGGGAVSEAEIRPVHRDTRSIMPACNEWIKLSGFHVAASWLTPQREQETPIEPLQDKDDGAGNEDEEDMNMRKMRKNTKLQRAQRNVH